MEVTKIYESRFIARHIATRSHYRRHDTIALNLSRQKICYVKREVNQAVMKKPPTVCGISKFCILLATIVL